MTKEDIRFRRKALTDLIADLNRQIDHIKVDLQHLYLDCPHPDRKYYNDPRDPGGSDCPDCGKSW